MAVTAPNTPPPLLPGTRALCRHEPFRATDDRLTLGQGPGRLGLAVLILAAATLLGWLLPARHAATPGLQWLGSFAVGLLLAAGYLYRQVVRPLLHRPASYRLVGEFVVREKYEVLGKRLLRIGSADAQVVYVGPGLYGQLRAGDWVQVIYTADGSLVSCTKWAGTARK